VIASGGDRQRLDRWLWFARIIKSRTLAQKFIASGAVRVDSQRVTSPDQRVGPGSVLTFPLHNRIRVLRVLDVGTRRGPASEAVTLYEDLSPAPPGTRPETGGAG
jgi:ribosome-associated heat shock protein Hsp15